MNHTADSRFRIRLILVVIILATIPCYCSGLLLVRTFGGPGDEQPTSTPLWVQPATETAAAATALVPSFTPFYVTATPPSPTLPALIPTFTRPPTSTPPSPTITASPTIPLPPTTQPPTATLSPTETLPPTVTNTPTPEPTELDQNPTP